MKELKASDFVPEKEVGTLSMADFIPAKSEKEKPKVSKTGASGLGFADSLSMGYADEVDNWISEKMPWYDDLKANMGNEYSQAIVAGRASGIKPSEIRRQFEEAAVAQHPYAYGSGQVAGAVPGIVGLGGLGTVAKGASLGARIGAGAKASSVYGAIEGAGRAEEGGRLEGAAKGGLTGLAIGGGLPLVGGAIKHTLSGVGRAVKEIPEKAMEFFGLPAPVVRKILESKKPVTSAMNISTDKIAKNIEPKARELMGTIKDLKTGIYDQLETSEPILSTEIFGAFLNGLEGETKKLGQTTHPDYKKISNTINDFIMRQNENKIIKVGGKKIDTEVAQLYELRDKIKASKNIGLGITDDSLANSINKIDEQIITLKSQPNKNYHLKPIQMMGLMEELKAKAAFTKLDPREAQELAKRYSKAHHSIGELIRTKLEPIGFAEQWDDVIQKADLLDDITKKRQFIIDEGKEGDINVEWKKWGAYVDGLKREVSNQIRKGENIDYSMQRIRQFDELMKTNIADTIEEKALYQATLKPSGASEELTSARGIISPMLRETLNILSPVYRASPLQKTKAGISKVSETVGLNTIAKKFAGTKWSEALTDSLKKNGTQGMAATHMMLMATDQKYREKYGESK